MVNLEDLERIDRVIDNIVDLQAKLKEDVESRDAKLQKYEKLFDDMEKVKSNLEAKISGFERQFKDFTNTNKILETQLESKNARINCLETKLKALESKIIGLEANKENILPEKETAVLKVEKSVTNNVNKRSQYALEEIETTNKKVKIEDRVKEEAGHNIGAVTDDGVPIAVGVFNEALASVDSEIVNGERHTLSYAASLRLLASGEQRPFLGRDSNKKNLTYNNLNSDLKNMLSFTEAVFSFGFSTFKQNKIALFNHLQLNPVIAQTWLKNYVGDKSLRTIFDFKFDDVIIISKIRRIAESAAPLPV